MKRVYAVIIIATLAAAGCAPEYQTVNLINGADQVKIFRKSDPPVSCREIQPITAVSGEGCGQFGSLGSYQASYNALRNSIASLGGNAGLIDNEIPSHSEYNCYVNQYVINGVAYNCPAQVLADRQLQK